MSNNKLPNWCAKSVNDANIQENLKENSIQDDYKKLTRENECYRKELHVLRHKLEASKALNETLEQLLIQYEPRLWNNLSNRWR